MLHAYKNTPHSPIHKGHELDIEPKRKERQGRKEGESRGAQGHQPSVTVESYFSPRPSAVDSELNTEHAHCRARGQTEESHRGGLRTRSTAKPPDGIRSSKSGLCAAQRPLQIKKRKTAETGKLTVIVYIYSINIKQGCVKKKKKKHLTKWTKPKLL